MSDVTSGDIAFGAIVLSIFVPTMMVVGYLIVRFQHARQARAWRPLLGIVQGVVQPIVGGGTEGQMRGRYKGFDLVASMTPLMTSSDASSNEFSVTFLGVAGAQDWELAYVTRLRSLGKGPDVRIASQDAGLSARLEAAGLVAAVQRLGVLPDTPDPPVHYSSSRRQLTLQIETGTDWIPGEAQFVAMLDTLTVVAVMNARVNPPPG